MTGKGNGQRIEAVVESLALKAVARLGVPTLLGLLLFLAREAWIDQQRINAQVTANQRAIAVHAFWLEEHDRRLEALEHFRTDYTREVMR